MLFEVAGFLSGVAGVGVAFWLLYQRDSTRVVANIYSTGGVPPRGANE
jgi:hypothetical protein